MDGRPRGKRRELMLDRTDLVQERERVQRPEQRRVAWSFAAAGIASEVNRRAHGAGGSRDLPGAAAVIDPAVGWELTRWWSQPATQRQEEVDVCGTGPGMRLVERFTRTAAGRFDYELTVDDAGRPCARRSRTGHRAPGSPSDALPERLLPEVFPVRSF